jgi:hypothetical protein
MSLDTSEISELRQEPMVMDWVAVREVDRRVQLVRAV